LGSKKAREEMNIWDIFLFWWFWGVELRAYHLWGRFLFFFFSSLVIFGIGSYGFAQVNLDHDFPIYASRP
jgi:hypothetical protein